MSDNIIEVKGVIRDFPVSGGYFRALKDVNADFPKGKLTILC